MAPHQDARSDALIAAGGTITHHHAVGRDHMPWYRKQRPALFGKALEAAKTALDPREILNPGVLVPLAFPLPLWKRAARAARPRDG